MDQLDTVRERMRLDGGAIVLADVDVHADDTAMAHRLEQARVEDKRAAMRDTGLHDHVGADIPDHLLDADDVLTGSRGGPSR